MVRTLTAVPGPLSAERSFSRTPVGRNLPTATT